MNRARKVIRIHADRRWQRWDARHKRYVWCAARDERRERCVLLPSRYQVVERVAGRWRFAAA